MDYLTSVRETVDPPAKNMMLLNNSTKLENMTDAWLKNCSYCFANKSIHTEYANTDYIRLSGLLNESLSFADLKRLTSEKENCNFTTNTCPYVGGYIYKQMVWANSTHVGCAKHRCAYDTYFIEYVACIYEPSGNLEVDRPYQEGESCTGCPTGYFCNRKQCSLYPGEEITTTSISARLSVFGMVDAALFLMFFFV
uniref:SCP domain-containing protein n=1 Tax=Mesocestoides corti TaxID=53468 RepID=A0A5K3G2X7_MESCO